jgi:hypothetical protein
LPPSLEDWLPEDHEARFISDVVENLLDLSVIYDSYVKADGYPPYLTFRTSRHRYSPPLQDRVAWV